MMYITNNIDISEKQSFSCQQNIHKIQQTLSFSKPNQIHIRTLFGNLLNFSNPFSTFFIWIKKTIFSSHNCRYNKKMKVSSTFKRNMNSNISITIKFAKNFIIFIIPQQNILLFGYTSCNIIINLNLISLVSQHDKNHKFV